MKTYNPNCDCQACIAAQTSFQREYKKMDAGSRMVDHMDFMTIQDEIIVETSAGPLMVPIFSFGTSNQNTDFPRRPHA